MSLDIEDLQELEATETGLAGACPLGSCCNPAGFPPSILTCFGCTFTS